MIFKRVMTILLLSKIHCVPVEDVPEVQINFTDEEKAFDYLIKYGYNKDVISTFSSDGGQDAIKKFQEDGGLAQTGKLDLATMELMSSPRCGVPHAENQGQVKRWNKRELSYRVIQYSSKLSNSAIDRIVRKAMDFWEEAADIKFVKSRARSVDIEIMFAGGRRDHGDGLPFDGPSGTLAHAYFPGDYSLAGDAHFDDDEDWSDREFVGKQLLQTCTHELGHSLGLTHSSVRGSVMYFSYPGWDPNLRLHRDDITRIQNLYGKARPGLGPPTTGRPVGRPTRRPTGGSCSCSSFTRYDSRRKQQVGNCQTKYQGRLWCYIESTADCPDTRRSSSVNYDWSWQACNQRVTSTISPMRPSPGSCNCNGKTRFNKRLKETVGLCQSKYRGEFWCYISPESSCSDKEETRRNEDGFRNWSQLACDNETPFQVEDQIVEDQIVEDSPFIEDQQYIDSEP